MDSTSTKSISSNSTETSHSSSLSAKLRRLKIEENLLFQSINKCAPEYIQRDDGELNATSNSAITEFKNYSAKTKESLSQLKLLFQDIKTSTSKEMLQALDIDDVKRTTIELDNSIKTFKSYLQSELASLKSAEKSLNQSMNKNPVSINKLKKPPRVQTAKYNEIVPSPVKSIMNSPFKCSEVQKFQEFMTLSGNRYGGWTEYHHNIFVNYWKKHFGSETNKTAGEEISSEKKSSELYLFLQEILPKLQDISEEEVKLHINWYSEFLYLKERQQKSIDKWRSNRKIMRSAKVEPDSKSSKNPKSTEKRKIIFTHSDINNVVSDELMNLNDLVLQPTHHDGVRRIIRKCFNEELKNKRDDDEVSDQNLNTQSIITMKLENRVKTCEETQPRFQKTTKQWNIRINSKDDKTQTKYSNIENITKLHIPTWRVGL